jgi:hypothetical protein
VFRLFVMIAISGDTVWPYLLLSEAVVMSCSRETMEVKVCPFLTSKLSGRFNCGAGTHVLNSQWVTIIFLRKALAPSVQLRSCL